VGIALVERLCEVAAAAGASDVLLLT